MVLGTIVNALAQNLGRIKISDVSKSLGRISSSSSYRNNSSKRGFGPA